MSVPASSTATYRVSLDLAGLGVDLDDREVTAEGERRRRLELVCDLQLAEPSVDAGLDASSGPRERPVVDDVEGGSVVEHDVRGTRLEEVGREGGPRSTTASAASRPATPPICVDLEPKVPVPFGTSSVSPWWTMTRSTGSPSRSAAIIANVVSCPWPCEWSPCGGSRRRPR